MKNIPNFFIIVIILFFFSCQTQPSSESSTPKTKSSKLKALIIDGENNHGVWPKTTMMIKDYLEQTNLFEVDIERTAFTWQGPHFDKIIGLEDIKTLLEMYPIPSNKKTTVVEEPKPDPSFSPNFNNYDVVISNMGWKASTWPKATVNNFEKYMADGGGFVLIHAANNSWGDWNAYNKMIGIGGWGGRSQETGPYVYYDDENQRHDDPSEGQCGSHGPQAEFVLTTRTPSHPIMNGLPTEWLHTKDELYDRLRGPAKNLTVLATAYSDVEGNSPPWDKKVSGTGRHEPMLMTIDYGKGRVFHSCLGHMDYSMECVGFITTLQRGAEWAATGKVTQDIPKDFPSKEKISARTWDK